MMLPTATLVARHQDEAVLALAAPAAHEAFEGHFVGYPVLPGVVQIDWAVRFAAEWLDIGDVSTRRVRVKFRNIIVPDTALTLTLQFERRKRRLHFTYLSGEDVMSSGQVTLGT